jgi:PAS domain S-box-containing protein
MNKRTPTILIVEDEVVVARDIDAQLREGGYQPVGHAMRGEDAIALAQSLKPDLVLMDIRLAGEMDGISAAEAIHTQLGIPVVFLTAFASPEVLERAKKTQPFGFLHKPFSERDLSTGIEMALFRSDADAKLRASEARFRAIFDAEQECVMVISARGELLQINAAGLQVLEVDTLEAAAIKPLLDYIHSNDQAPFGSLLSRVISGDSGSLTFEIRGQRGGNRLLETHAVAMRDAVGDAPLVLAISRDITHRRIAAHERRLGDHIFSAVSQGVVVTTPYQTILSVNKAFLEMTGFTREELVGKTCGLLQGPLTDAQSRAQIREAITQNQEFQGEIVNYRKDGAWFWNDLSISPVRDELGVVTNFIGVMRDVTNRKQAEDEQRVQLRQLQSLSRRVLEVQESERRRLARELHDELGQSLTAIKINLQANNRHHLTQSADVNAESIRIVENTLAQVRTLALALRPSMLDDLGLVPALQWIVEQNAARGQIQIDLQCALPEVRLCTEIETACFRIVQEALTNILRHAQCKRVDIQLYESEGTVELDISDDGRGFDVRAMMALSTAGGSMGVQGMQERAVLVGGNLQVESIPGSGSNLHMQCPLRLREVL